MELVCGALLTLVVVNRSSRCCSLAERLARSVACVPKKVREAVNESFDKGVWRGCRNAYGGKLCRTDTETRA